MKSFQSFRLDPANQCLWRGEERVPIAPKAYDVLRYLVENPGRLVKPDELLEALWPKTYVNPEILRKYILDIRKVLGDRYDKPVFIETVTKRGYRFVAPVSDENPTELPDLPKLPAGSPELSADAPVRLSAGSTAESPPTAPVESPATLPAALPEPFPLKSELQIPSVKTGLRRLVLLPVLALIVTTTIGGYFWFARKSAHALVLSSNSIAVLPFVDMSPGQDQEYFSDGLAEELINDLAKVPNLKVVGRSSAFQFKGKNEDLRSVGRKLGVANVLEGSVRKEGSRVRITADLTKVGDGFQLWSQTYDRDASDILAVQDEIARAATEALQLKLLGGNGQPVSRNSRSANPEAYQAYLEANYFLGRGTGREDLYKALTYADHAIKLDQEYGPAWALRASVQNSMAEEGFTDVTTGFRKARDDAERAIALDPTSASGYLALARTQIYHDWDWDTATTCLAKAAALEPGSAEVVRTRSYLFRVLGNLDEAVKVYEQAVALDPLRANSHLGLGNTLYIAGRYDEARAEMQKALELNPQSAFAHADLGRILIAEGRPQLALVEIEKESTDWEKRTDRAVVYHALGRERDSNAALSELIATHSADSAYQIAQVYAFRRESDKSFEWLDRAYKQRDSGLPEIKTDPLFKTLRHDPRYTELLQKMHLPT
jgi:TolB-like protein/DNA-binding winged helix-turn-helix (wHTH) protein/Flp pilus assembly protein TadD